MSNESDDNIKRLEAEHKIMEGYIDTAKTYTQLSLGALVLSITFIEKVLGEQGRISVHFMLILSWIFWLVAALAGAFYQYLAIRFLENLGERLGVLTRSGHPQPFSNLARHPFKIYGLLLICFYLGAVFFAVFGIMKLI